MFFYLFPIFNFNTARWRSQRVCSGFFLLESCIALGMALFLCSIFIGFFVSWLAYARHTQCSTRACLYAQAYAETLVAQRSLRFAPFEYNADHEGHAVAVCFHKDKHVPRFIHAILSVRSLKNHLTLYAGYVY